jgi:hypothetical protein
MIVYVDENMPPRLAEALNLLQQPLNTKGIGVEVQSIVHAFGRGTKDEVWIPRAGQQGACILTQDFNIHRIRHQRALCEEHKLGMFFIQPPSKSGLLYWDMVKLVIDRWEQLIKIVNREQPAFYYRCTANKKFETF